MRVIKWHKEYGDWLIKKIGLSWCSVAWISWLKSLIAGVITYHFLFDAV